MAAKTLNPLALLAAWQASQQVAYPQQVFSLPRPLFSQMLQKKCWRICSTINCKVCPVQIESAMDSHSARCWHDSVCRSDLASSFAEGNLLGLQLPETQTLHQRIRSDANTLCWHFQRETLRAILVILRRLLQKGLFKLLGSSKNSSSMLCHFSGFCFC